MDGVAVPPKSNILDELEPVDIVAARPPVRQFSLPDIQDLYSPLEISDVDPDQQDAADVDAKQIMAKRPIVIGGLQHLAALRRSKFQIARSLRTMSSQSYFYLHVTAILAVVGFIAGSLGCCLGWLLWRDSKGDANRLQAENDSIREEIKNVESIHLEVSPSNTN